MKKLYSLLSAMAILAMPCLNAAEKKAENPCDCMESGMGFPKNQACHPASYNQHANIKMENAFDFTGQVSFLYWYVAQENMYVGVKKATDPAGNTHDKVLYPSFDFQPGFKLGLAMDTKYDDWRVFVDYTYMHQHTTHDADIPSTATVENIYGTTVADSEVVSKWKMNMDMVDIGLNRAFYKSTKVTLSPVAAFRVLSIRQHLNVIYVIPSSPADKYLEKTYNWALGPMFGSYAHCMFDHGWRFEGKAAAALLYTRFSQQEIQNGVTDSTYARNNFNTVRPMAELGLGLGWGTYTNCRDYYFDISARYDFNVFWNQNEMVNTNDATFLGSSTGNLYMHGLTLTGRIDF